MLGLGSIWAQGLSGSAALQMATPGALQPQIRDIVAAGGLVPGGIISFRHTIFLWQSLLSVAVEIAVVCAVMWLADSARRARRRRQRLLASTSVRARSREPPDAGSPIPPGAWLEHSPLLNLLIVALGVVLSRRATSPARRSRSTP